MSAGAETSTHPQRRVRHLTSIQVRNLTAFPVRDAFASALSQPADKNGTGPSGYVADDLDVTLARRRTRRISMNSIGTVKSDESGGDEGSISESRGRRSAGSRMSFHGGGSVGPGSVGSRLHNAASAAPTIRGHRPRTTSMTSSLHSFGVSNAGGSSAFPRALPDHSQIGLEKILKARLFETFIAVSVDVPPEPEAADPVSVPLPQSTPASPLLPSTAPTSPRSPNTPNTFPRKGTKPSPLIPSDKSSSNGNARRDTSTPASPVSPNRHSKSASVSVLRPNGKAAAAAGALSARKTLPSQAPAPPARVKTPEPASPDFISPVHRPSTNPLFNVDAKSWTSPSGQKLKVELWGKVKEDWKRNDSVSVKGKERQWQEQDEEDHWRVLEQWAVDLEQLVPISDDTEIPSNTLVINLLPPGRSFYLPSNLQRERLHAKSSSVDAGYASDPESAARKSTELAPDTTPESLAVDVKALSRRRLRRGNEDQALAKTANWQDLFKLVTLQACIVDNETSSNDVIRETDKILESDQLWVLKRQISERESIVQGMRKSCAAVYDESEILKEKIEMRRQQIQERREMLAMAHEITQADMSLSCGEDEEVAAARSELVTLRSRFTPTRTTLISTLASIFPIDILSPPDLLFTILGVPLPIPLSVSDPGPPLSLPSHKDVTEDAVATALGYVAQVVQLLAAYLGKGLVYPVTCIGSRSMIRDGISAMVGPRMFPLFSRGVDTYRFEYGVFLLNKDIELLMADKDLRALDMRQTLPNLKNLLLTLTDGEGAPLVHGSRSFDSPELSITGLESPRPGSPAEVTTPKADNSELPPTDRDTPPASGSTTPTTVETTKKSRFMGLSPIAGFLRARYPSAIRVTRPESESAAEPAEEESSPADDDADSRTLHGAPAPDEQPDPGRASEKSDDVSSAVANLSVAPVQ